MTLTSDKTAQQWVDHLCTTHEDFYREAPGGQLTQMIVMENPDGEVAMLMCPWASQREREVVLDALALAVNGLGIVRYAFFAETWVSEVTSKDGTVPPTPKTRPSQDPNRKEMVFTICCDRRLPEPIVARQDIVRGPDGKVLRLEREPPQKDMHMMGGALANLFDRQGVVQ